jgi:hypothetical protein
VREGEACKLNTVCVLISGRPAVIAPIELVTHVVSASGTGFISLCKCVCKRDNIEVAENTERLSVKESVHDPCRIG